MNADDLDLKIKKYERLYLKKPKTRVFALLADLYRKKKKLDKAFHLCQKGIKDNPQEAFGYIALALIYLDMAKLELAVEQLEKAVQLAPENLFAYKLLGQMYLKLKKPKRTLQAYKMVLLLDPDNSKAKSIIRKLETAFSKSADDTGFVFKNLKEVSSIIAPSDTQKPSEPIIHPKLKMDSVKELNRFNSRLSIVEALICKKDFHKAQQMIREMYNIYKTTSTIQAIKRQENALEKILQANKKSPKSIIRKKKIKRLKTLLTKIEERPA